MTIALDAAPPARAAVVLVVLAMASAIAVAAAPIPRAGGRRVRTRLRATERLSLGPIGDGRGDPARWSRLPVLGAPPAWFRSRLVDLAVDVDPGAAWRALVLGALVVSGTAALVGGPLAGVAAALVGAAVVAVAADVGRGRADRKVDAELPTLLDRLAGAIRSGASLATALREGAPAARGPLQSDLRELAAALDAGLPLAVALDRWRDRRDTPGTRLTVSALGLSARLAGQARPLEGVASTLRDRLAIERELRAVSAQTRASALVLVAVPVAFLAFSTAQDSGWLPFFVDTALGRACLLGGIGLDLVGGWWMLRLIGTSR